MAVTPVLAQALHLREIGFAIHWVQPKSKVPVLKDWAQRQVLTPEELEDSYRADYNVGFRPGRWSVVHGKEVVVLDVDIKDSRYEEEAYAAANAIMDGKFNPHAASGSGPGRHQFMGWERGSAPAKAATTLRESDVWLLNGLPCSPRTRGSRPAWLIELLSTAKNVVLPPSIHPDTGLTYRWLRSPDEA